MVTFGRGLRVYLASAPIDMRRGHDGLMAIVKNEWRMDPFSGALYVFLGRRLDRAKILVFDRGGFVLVYKRLEKGRFRLPSASVGATTVTLDVTELAMLLDGIDLSRVRRPELWEPATKVG